MKTITVEISGDLYRGRWGRTRMLSHTAELDAQGHIVRVLCGVKLDSLAEPDIATKNTAPTCDRCRRLLARPDAGDATTD